MTQLKKGLIFHIILYLLLLPGKSYGLYGFKDYGFADYVYDNAAEAYPRITALATRETEDSAFEKNCTKEGGIGDKMICVQNGKAMIAPNFPNKTEIEIEMSDVKIIEIKDELKQFTIKIGLMMNWFEHRLILNSNYDTLVIENEEIQDNMWSPRMKILTEMVPAKKIQETVIEVQRSNFQPDCNYTKKVVVKKLSLTATLMCPLNFTNFPFDKHACKIEVSRLFQCSYLNLFKK